MSKSVTCAATAVVALALAPVAHADTNVACPPGVDKYFTAGPNRGLPCYDFTGICQTYQRQGRDFVGAFIQGWYEVSESKAKSILSDANCG
jgi:hypothetical protein